MGSRLELHALLSEVAETENVYFQPPASLIMKYPCVVYKFDGIDTDYADDIPYRLEKRYQVTYIYKNPDSEVPMAIASLQKCRFDRNFVSDNLYHSIFSLHF